MPLRLSSLFLRTLREDPVDADVDSHKLLVRAGYIRRAAPGIYTWLPLGLNVLGKVERIVREEMNAIGAQEVHFPALLQSETYEVTNSWTEYGENLFRLQDRKNADLLLGPTHEEMFANAVKDMYSSYKDFPVTLYQIQTKYRDEERPRAGVLRGREFVMKDSYSFDMNDEGLDSSYARHRKAYQNVFDRLEIEYAICKATSGAMGGSASEEFLALSEVGEDLFVRSTEGQAKTWEDLPEDIRNTYEKLGIPEAERERLVACVAAQYESEVVYHHIREDLEQQGVIFVDTDTALKEHEEIFREYFGTVIPTGDNKFAALNTAVWSGGSFIYVPKGVHVDIPLQAYFRINTENMGQFERTLIVADEGSYVHYIEGCTAPIYKSDSLHSAVVEIVVKKNARVRYTTIQNWSNNVYNLVTKRTLCEEGGTMEWVDGNIGSKVTQKYPAVYMVGEHAKGETLSIAFAGEGQHQDTGSKMVHIAPHTSSSIVSKSIARNGGRAAYRGLVQVREGAHHSKSSVVCDALLVDTISRSDTYPYVDVREDDVTMGHEATVSRVSEEQLFYLMQRGLTEEEAMAMIVRGFVEPIARELPMEYALELNRLIELQMEGSVG